MAGQRGWVVPNMIYSKVEYLWGSGGVVYESAKAGILKSFLLLSIAASVWACTIWGYRDIKITGFYACE